MGFTRRRSWSFTRSRLRAFCPRFFFFNYYVQGEPEADVAFSLRSLSTPEMVAGQQIDWTISYSLRQFAASGRRVHNLAELGLQSFRRNIAQSPDIVAEMRSGNRPRENSHPLVEHYYEAPLSEFRIEFLENRVLTCLREFERSTVLERILEASPRNWIDLKPPLTSSAPSFLLDDVLVYANYDFIFADSEALHVLDWKSGDRSPRTDNQLAVYGLYATLGLGYELGMVTVQAVYLSEPPVGWQPRRLTREELRTISSLIHSEVALEASLTQPSTNRDGQEVFVASRADFPAAPGPKKCLGCKFRAICPEGQAAAMNAYVVEQRVDDPEVE